MKQWKHKIDIKQYLGEDDSPEAVRSAAKGVVAELNKLRIAFAGAYAEYDLLEMIEGFEFVTEDDTPDVAEFNYILSDLYDWADAERVWLGL